MKGDKVTVDQLLNKGYYVASTVRPAIEYGNEITKIYKLGDKYYSVSYNDGYPDGIFSKWAYVKEVKPKTIKTWGPV